jgi:hypothetical protein
MDDMNASTIVLAVSSCRRCKKCEPSSQCASLLLIDHALYGAFGAAHPGVQPQAWHERRRRRMSQTATRRHDIGAAVTRA